MKKDITAFFIVLVVGLALSWPILNRPMIAEGDAYARAFLLLNDVKTGLTNLDYSGVWLPFFRYILQFPVMYLDLGYYGTRVIMMLASISSCFFIYKITQILFEKEKNRDILAITSAFLMLIFPLRLYLSADILTENLFLFFAVGATFFILKKQYYAFLLFFNLAHGIKFESWLMILPFLILILSDQKISNKKKYLFSILCALFPLWYMSKSFYYTGLFFSFFIDKTEVAVNKYTIYGIKEFWNWSLSLQAWMKGLWQVFTFSYSTFLILGIVKILSLKKYVKESKFIYFLIPFHLFLLLVAQVFFGTMEWFPIRYLLLICALLMPIIAYGFLEFLKIVYKLPLHYLVKPFAVITISLFFVLDYSSNLMVNDKYLDFNNNNEYEICSEIAEFLKNNADLSSQHSMLIKKAYHLPSFESQVCQEIVRYHLKTDTLNVSSDDFFFDDEMLRDDSENYLFDFIVTFEYFENSFSNYFLSHHEKIMNKELFIYKRVNNPIKILEENIK